MLKSISDNSWIDSKGTIWLQIIDHNTEILILIKNLFELYIVDIETEKNNLVLDPQQLLNILHDMNKIVCIPVGDMEIVGDLVYKIKKD